MTEYLSLGGILCGAALCAYAIQMRQSPDQAVAAQPVLNTNIKALFDAEQKKAHINKNKLPKIPGKKVIGLETVSNLWKKEVPLSDAADLWREPEEPPEALKKIPRPKFQNQEIEEFFVEYVMEKPTVKGSRRNIIVHLLKMLDQEGDCPSVVTGGDSEPENQIPQKNYDILAQIPLWKHSINVAKFFAKKTEKNPAYLPDVLIMALGHDIGKIPRHHNALYSTADHPQISISILNAIKEFSTLPNRTDLTRAIAGHHLMKTNDQMTGMLMFADQETRQLEFSNIYGKESGITEAVSRETTEQTEENDISKTAPVSWLKAKKKQKTTRNALGNVTTAPSPFSTPDEDGKYIPKEIPIPSWFDCQKLLDGLVPYVDTIFEENKGKFTWRAVSNDNVIYVTRETVWAILDELSEGTDTSFMAASTAESGRFDYLASIIGEMIKAGHIIDEYVSDYGHSCWCTVVTGGGKTYSMELIPFKTSSFGKLPSEFKEAKTPKLTRMVSNIKPKI